MTAREPPSGLIAPRPCAGDAVSSGCSPAGPPARRIKRKPAPDQGAAHAIARHSPRPREPVDDPQPSPPTPTCSPVAMRGNRGEPRSPTAIQTSPPRTRRSTRDEPSRPDLSVAHAVCDELTDHQRNIAQQGRAHMVTESRAHRCPRSPWRSFPSREPKRQRCKCLRHAAVSDRLSRGRSSTTQPMRRPSRPAHSPSRARAAHCATP